MKAQRGPAVFTLNSTKSTTIDTPFGNMTFLVVMLLLLILDICLLWSGDGPEFKFPKSVTKKQLYQKIV